MLFKSFHSCYSGSWWRVHRLRCHEMVQSSGTTCWRYAIWSPGRYMGHRVCVCRAPHRTGTVAREIWCRSTVSYKKDFRYINESLILEWNPKDHKPSNLKSNHHFIWNGLKSWKYDGNTNPSCSYWHSVCAWKCCVRFKIIESFMVKWHTKFDHAIKCVWSVLMVCLQVRTESSRCGKQKLWPAIET